MKIRNYRELRRLETFDDRFDYLSLKGVVGETTFGFDRYINQQFYRSREWRLLRDEVILRDEGRDLGVPGYEIHSKILIHHMNPLTKDQLIHRDEDLFDPNFLITTTIQTHNAIHYGDKKLLPKLFVERRRGDTKLW